VNVPNEVFIYALLLTDLNCSKHEHLSPDFPHIKDFITAQGAKPAAITPMSRNTFTCRVFDDSPWLSIFISFPVAELGCAN
jgi:hypothetical protein